MQRNSLLETAGRAMSGAVRMTLNKSNDDPMMQTSDFDGMNSDGRNKVERVQGFGFSSVPLPRDEDDKKQSGGDSTVEKEKGPAAEGIAIFLGGQRNHPVVIAVDDRRHRPMGMKPGENAQYDDQGQMTLLRRGGLFLLSLDDEGDGSAPGATMLRDAEGKATGESEKKERMVSLRHVVKKKQERKSGSQNGSGGGGGSSSKQDYKHEGEEVNTEVRATKNKIEIFDKDQVVAVYDRESGQWTFTAKKMEITCSETMKIDVTGKLDIKGHPIVFNDGTSPATPFRIP